MNLFEIDFFNKTINLIKEAFKFKKYKAMNGFFAVVVGITMIPFVLLSFYLLLLVILETFLFKVLINLVNSLKLLVNQEGKEVHPATQFIIYLVSWPVLLALYLILSLSYVWIIIFYAILSLVTYIWTLGGFKFHLFAYEKDDISIEVNEKYRKALILTYVLIALIGFVAFVAYGVYTYVDLYYYFMEDLIIEYLLPFVYFGNIFTLLYTLIGLAPRPKFKTE